MHGYLAEELELPISTAGMTDDETNTLDRKGTSAGLRYEAFHFAAYQFASAESAGAQHQQWSPSIQVGI